MWAASAQPRSGAASGGAAATDPLFTSLRRNGGPKNETATTWPGLVSSITTQ